jgi:hypothetical protein
MFPHLLTVFRDVNFPAVDLLDHVIFDELVDDFTLLDLHLHLGLHGFRGQEEDDISRGQALELPPNAFGLSFPQGFPYLVFQFLVGLVLGNHEGEGFFFSFSWHCATAAGPR